MRLVLEYVDGWAEELIVPKGKARAAGPSPSPGRGRGPGHAHGRGVIHRDVQPHNILVSKAVRSARHLAAAAGERLPTAPEMLEGTTGFGTPAYMSPEQLLENPKTPGAICFLGIVLYE
jgi:serine/threonine-protein kinase